VNCQAARKCGPGNVPLFRIMIKDRFREAAPVKVARANKQDARSCITGLGNSVIHSSKRLVDFFSVQSGHGKPPLRRRHISRKSRGPATKEFLFASKGFAYFAECP
jgi:hypothetical protein